MYNLYEQLTNNFQLYEFVRPHRKKYLTPEIYENVKKLAIELQKVRDHFGQAIQITSGFRDVKSNTTVGGSKNSKHLTGKAADFYMYGTPLALVYRYLEHYHAGGLAINNNLNFIHIDTCENPPRRRWFY